RQTVVEVSGRLDHRLEDPRSVVRAPAARKPPGDERVVVRPDGSVVIDERVVGTLTDGHRAHPPAGPERVAHEQVGNRLLARLRDDATPEQMPEVGGQRVDRALLPVEPESVEAALGEPEHLVETASKLARITLELVG